MRGLESWRRLRPAKERHGLDSPVDGTLGGRVHHVLPARSQLHKVVGIELKHGRGQKWEEARLGVVRIGQRMEQGGHDLDLGGAREGRATRNHALEPMGAQRVDVKVCLAGGAKEQRHVGRALACSGIRREAVCYLSCARGRG